MAQPNVFFKGEEKKFAINIAAAGFSMDTDDFEIEVTSGRDNVSVLKTGEPTAAGIWANEDGTLVTFYEETQAQSAEAIVQDYVGYSGTANGYVLVEGTPDIYFYDDDSNTITLHHRASAGDIYHVNGDDHYYRFDGSTWVDIGTTVTTTKNWYCILDTKDFTTTGQLTVTATAYITDAKAYDGVRKCIDQAVLGTLKNK